MGAGIFHSINPYYSFSGLIIGFLVGMTGVGGGSLMTPLLILLFKFHPATAVGTDLLYASITKSGGTVVHGAKKTVDWRVTRRLALGSVPATGLTIFLLAHFEKKSVATTEVVTYVLGGVLMLTALILLYRSRIVDFAAKLRPIPENHVRTLTIFTGAVLGIIVSLTSVGAGAIGVTVLLMLYPTIPTVKLVGSDIAHAVPLTLIAGIGHWFLGDINWHLLVSLLVGSLPGIVLGSNLVVKVPDRLLRQIMAVTLILVAGRLMGI